MAKEKHGKKEEKGKEIENNNGKRKPLKKKGKGIEKMRKGKHQKRNEKKLEKSIMGKGKH